MKVDIWITKRTRDTLMFVGGFTGAIWAGFRGDPGLVTVFAMLAGLGPILTAQDQSKRDHDANTYDEDNHPHRRRTDPKSGGTDGN